MLKDACLSFCPAAVRRDHRPESTERALGAAKITGFLQTLFFAALLVFQYIAFIRQRTHQFGSVLGNAAPAVQAGGLIIFTFDFLIHPISLLLLYLMVEGALRFLGGVVFGEIVPSFSVFLAFKLRGYRRAKPQVVIEDTFENLPDGERVKIASAHPKSGWNATITIEIDGRWYEVEKEEIGMQPRTYIYLLRPAPMGKILRKYERYMLPAAESIGTIPEVQS